MTTKFIISLVLSLAGCLGAAAAHSATNCDPMATGTQFQVYPITDDSQAPALTPAPEGYEPFHMEHYGRHGSRWFSHPIRYDKPLAQLVKAQKAGKLTDNGIRLLNTIRFIADTTALRVGDLTPLGHLQHRGIARRMVSNFPEIFRKGAYVNGVSTIIIRCILSMNNELQQFERMVPGINVKFDASKSTWSMLNSTITDSVSMAIFSKASKTTLQDFGRSYCSDISYFTHRTFNDPQWAMDSLDMRNLAIDVAKIVISAQNYDNLYDLSDAMSIDELRREDGYRRVYWYLKSANAPQTYGRMPYVNRHLLANIIQSTDTAITSTSPSANMRFGHDTVLMPLLVLMEIDGAHLANTADLTYIARNWDAGHYLPMACNLQLIFYRPANGRKGDILVKALLNEHEVTMPGNTDHFPYYKWSNLRRYYQTKLDEFPTRFADIDKTTLDNNTKIKQ